MMFTVEETSLMCMYDTVSKNGITVGIRENLRYVNDPEMRALMESVTTKLSTMTDEDFSRIRLNKAAARER